MDLALEIRERKTGGLSAGGGISATGAMEGALPGVVGEVSYSQRNLFGLGQRLVASAKLGQVCGQGCGLRCGCGCAGGESGWVGGQREPFSLQGLLRPASVLCATRGKLCSAVLALIMLRCAMLPMLCRALLQTDAMFRVQHTDPWVRGDAHRTSRTTTIQVSQHVRQHGKFQCQPISASR